MMWSDHGGWSTGNWVAMSFVMVVLAGLLVALIAWLLDRARVEAAASTGEHDHASHADDVLAQRFAHGDIDEAEFTRSRELLHESSVRSSPR